MTSDVELWPCPFCGNDYGILQDTHGYSVFCGHCISSTGDYKTKEEAVAAWNRRTDGKGVLNGYKEEEE